MKKNNKKPNTNLKASPSQLKKFLDVCKEHECEPQQIDKKKLKEIVKDVNKKEE